MTEQFHRPVTPAQAVELAAKSDGRGVFLAGGTSFEGADYHRGLEVLIDVTALGLKAIETTAAGLDLGAGCTLQEIHDSEAAYGALKDAVRQVGNRNIRNLATLGGQIGANESVGDVLPTLVAMAASVDVLTDSGERRLDVADYLAAPSAGLITRVHVPAPPQGRAVAVDAFALTAIDRSIVTVAASLGRDGENVREAILAVGGVADRVIRLSAVEAALEGAVLPPREELEHLVQEHVSPRADVRGSAEYRRHLAGVLCESVLRAAYEEAGR